MSYCPPSTAMPDADRMRESRNLRWHQRIAMVSGGFVLIALLVVAFLLKPNPDGMGTHRQLGLPPCTLVVLAGVRCPSCGMTTSWAHLVRGNLVGSLRANSGGTLFAVAALTSAPWLVISGLAGRWKVWQPNERVLLTIGLTVITVSLVDWFLRLKLGL